MNYEAYQLGERMRGLGIPQEKIKDFLKKAYGCFGRSLHYPESVDVRARELREKNAGVEEAILNIEEEMKSGLFS